MHKRLMIGGVVVAAALLATFFSGLFDGFGTGVGDGDGTQMSTAGNDAADPSREQAEDEQSRSRDNQEQQKENASDVLEVVIDGQSYAVREAGGSEIRPVELPELVELAKKVPGEETGIRVRIYRRESALPTAELALTEALSEAGLSEEQGNVHWEEDLLE